MNFSQSTGGSAKSEGLELPKNKFSLWYTISQLFLLRVQLQWQTVPKSLVEDRHAQVSLQVAINIVALYVNLR